MDRKPDPIAPRSERIIQCSMRGTTFGVDPLAWIYRVLNISLGREIETLFSTSKHPPIASDRDRVETWLVTTLPSYRVRSQWSSNTIRIFVCCYKSGQKFLWNLSRHEWALRTGVCTLAAKSRGSRQIQRFVVKVKHSPLAVVNVKPDEVLYAAVFSKIANPFSFWDVRCARKPVRSL